MSILSREEQSVDDLQSTYITVFGTSPGNVKDQQLNDVADWVEDEGVNYHTFQVPYGPKYHAKKVSRHRWCFQSYIFASSSSLSKERHPLPLIDNHGHVFIVSRRSLG
jgi:hypothetical protein